MPIGEEHHPLERGECPASRPTYLELSTMIQPCLTALLLMPFISSLSLAAPSHETEPASPSEFMVMDEGPAISGWFEASYNDMGASYSDVGGNFAVGRNRIQVAGDFDHVSYMISVGYEDETSNFGLRDAYATATWGITDWTFGQFRAPTTSAHLINEANQFFLDRTGFGGNGLRQTGLMGSGKFDNFGWAVALMDDEADLLDPTDDEDLHARVHFDVLGASAATSEGSYETLGNTHLSVAAAIDRGESGDTTYIEATVSNGPFWAYAELVDTDTKNPFTVAATYAINTQWEIGMRTQDDDTDWNPTTSAAITRYISGHDCKWTIQFADGGRTNKSLSAGFLVGF